MKFKIYEVALENGEGRDINSQSFLYAEYEDAVTKFKKLIEDQKKVDWITEWLHIADMYEGYDVDVIETMDLWAIHVGPSRNNIRMYSQVRIIEREVF